MDFRITEDQVALQEGIRTFCEGRFPFDQITDLEKNPLDRACWNEIAEMGVFSLRQAEEDGGVGLAMTDAVLVFAELGRRLVPGPLLWSHLAAGLVEGAGSGDVIVGGVDAIAHPEQPALVEYLPGIDVLLILRPDGVYRADAKGIVGAPVATPLDPLTPVSHVEALPAGEKIADAEQARALHVEGQILSAGLYLGIAESTLAYAVEYAKSREQFDRVIGSFQALKHMMADMQLRQEQARAIAYAAGATFDQPDVDDVVRLAAAAKLLAGECAMKNARACLQIYGGMGYTWEMPPHYYLKRTFVLDNAFGGVDEHALVIADRLTGP